MLSHPNLELKKSLGAYYTPAELSNVLAQFAITRSDSTVLEPSFGGGVFIRSAAARLVALGAEKPEKQIFGCDVDAHAFDWLPSYLGKRIGREGRRFIQQDFMLVEPSDFSVGKFDCVIGNPPYIGYSKLNEAQRVRALKILQSYSIGGTRYASLWFFFVINSLRFLKEGGRIAFVLPHALIDNNYGQSLIRFLETKFSAVSTFSLPPKIFSNQGTHERVVVLTAHSFGAGCASSQSGTKATRVGSYVELSNALEAFAQGRQFGAHRLHCSAGRVDGAINNIETSLINEVVNGRQAVDLGSLLDLRIGLVTGDAKFFVMNEAHSVRLGLDAKKHVRPLMRTMKGHSSIAFTATDFNNRKDAGEDCYLLKYEEGYLKDECYVQYLNSYDELKIDSNRTFQRRPVWCDIDDGLVPDLFLAYMSMYGPKALVNLAKAQCINSTHRGYLKTGLPSYYSKLISISLLTTFSQVLAELNAKVYGNRVLKMEPSFYSGLKVLIPTDITYQKVIKCYDRIDALLRSGKSDAALSLASAFIYEHCFRPAQADKYMREYQRLLEKLRKSRIDS